MMKASYNTVTLHAGYAAMLGRTDIVKVLLKEKAKKDAHDGYGETALIKAVTNGHTASTEMLLNKGADPNKQSLGGV